MKKSLCKTLPLFLFIVLTMCLLLVPSASADDLFQQLKAACTSQNPPAAFDLTNSSEVVIEEDLTIPAGMTVDARGTNFVVPVGKHMTVSGKLILDRWNLNGQTNSIVIPEGGELHITAWRGLAPNIWGGWIEDGSVDRVTFEENAGIDLNFDVGNDEQMANAFDFANMCVNRYRPHVHFNIHVHFATTLPGSVTIPEGGTFILHDTFTVPSGVTLWVDGTLSAAPDVVMAINGRLVNNGFVEMAKRTTADAKLRINGTYSGSGTFGIKDHGDLSGYFHGIDLNNYEAVPDDIGTRFFYIGGKSFAGLKAACERADAYFDLTDFGVIVIEEDLTIPAGMTVDASGTNFVVPVGNSVTVNGKLILTEWNLNGQPGSIVISEGGNLHIAAWRDLVATIWDSWVSSGWVDDGKVTFGNDAGVYVRIMADDDQSLATALDAQPREHTQYKIHVNYPWSVSGSVVIPGHIRIILENGLTVPAGAALKVYGNMTAVHDVVMTVNGVLFNNNFIEMESRNTATGAMLRVNGKYSGAGSLGVKDHNDPNGYFYGVDLWAYRRETDDIGNRYFFNREPDLWLPAALNEIGDEAFAGGAFVFPVVPDETETIGSLAFANCPNLAYIHIPENVTVIDGHAFDGVTGLTIFCYPGSEAESFAQDHGFNCWQAR